MAKAIKITQYSKDSVVDYHTVEEVDIDTYDNLRDRVKRFNDRRVFQKIAGRAFSFDEYEITNLGQTVSVSETIMWLGY